MPDFATWFQHGRKVAVLYDWREQPAKHPMPPGTTGTVYEVDLSHMTNVVPCASGNVLVLFRDRPGLAAHILEAPMVALAPANILERLAWESASE